MKHLKPFNDFLIESLQDRLIDKILISLEDDILVLIQKHKEAFVKHFNREMTAYDKELTRLNITFDMVKAIESYTLPTDLLITISSSTSNKGNLEIFAQIQRDETVYKFNTEVIYAGGYNIQKLHYRYITKTDLPKTGNSQVSKEYADKLKKLSRLEKLNLEIQSHETAINNALEKLEISTKKSEAEIEEEILNDADIYKWPSWEVIVKRGADKNYNYSEDFYNSKAKEAREDNIASWKRRYISSVLSNIEARKAIIVKLNKKIEQLI